MNLLKMLRMNLQFFNQDDTGGTNPGKGEEETPPSEEETPPGDDDEKKIDEPLFTQEQVNKIVQQRLERAIKDKEKAIEEAQKLAKMNAEQKREYELKKAQEENERLKAELNRYELGKTASAILAESGIQADDEILDFVVRDDADQTNDAVQSFIKLVDRVAEERMKQKLRGNAPKRQTGQQATMTKKDILEIQDPAKRIKAIQENQHLFK